MLNKNTCSVPTLSYASSKQMDAPLHCIVPVFYHERAVRVNAPDDALFQFAIRIVKEMAFIHSPPGQMGN